MPYDDPHEPRPVPPPPQPRTPEPPSTLPPRQGSPSDRPAPRGEAPDTGEPPRRSPLVWVVLGLIVLAAASGGGWYWYATRNEVSTDDAYTDGRAMTIAPQGVRLRHRLLVTDNQFVARRRVLLRIDPRD